MNPEQVADLITALNEISNIIWFAGLSIAIELFAILFVLAFKK